MTVVNLKGITALNITGASGLSVANGVVAMTVSGGSTINLETNGVPNTSQSTLNLVAGTNITLTADGLGGVTIDSTAGGTGTVTHTAGALTANQLVIGNGAADEKVLGGLGTTTTVLHGNAGGAPSFGAVVEADITLANNTTNNVSSTKHGFTPISPSDATQFLNGAATPAYAAVKDSDLSTSNITTNNVSTSKHGFAPILPNDATKYLDGTGAYTVPAGGSSLNAFKNWHGFAAGVGSATLAAAAFYSCVPAQSGQLIGGGGLTAVNSPTATLPARYNIIGSTSAQSAVYVSSLGINGTALKMFTLGNLVSAQTAVMLGSLTNERIWYLVTDQTGSATSKFVNIDTPVANYAGFRFSTAAGDTHWQACCGTDGTHQTLSDTGVTPSTTTLQTLTIVPSGSSVLFYINGTLVATIATNVPTNTTTMADFLSIDNANSANARGLDFPYMYWETR
jgi:hypothetical protein